MSNRDDLTTRILAVQLGDNDSGATTVRDYLKALLRKLWVEEESFSGKRPFGNSGWKHDLVPGLIKAGIITGTLDEDGYADTFDEDGFHNLMLATIDSLI